MKYPKHKSKFLTGNEPILDNTGTKIAEVGDFWSWAYSNLLGNTERGALAEYIVACALHIQHEERIAWRKYDLLSSEGIAIEVKTSGYLQTWGQDKLSALTFGIQPTYGWDESRNQYDSIKKRQADVYIFCVHNHTNPETVNPLEISQWDFYVLETEVLNRKVGVQKSISLSSLLKLGAKKCGFSELHGEVVACYHNRIS